MRVNNVLCKVEIIVVQEYLKLIGQIHRELSIILLKQKWSKNKKTTTF